MSDVWILGKSCKLKSFIFSFGHSMRKIIIIEVDFLENICNKKHNKYKLNHSSCIMSNEAIGWQRR